MFSPGKSSTYLTVRHLIIVWWNLKNNMKKVGKNLFGWFIAIIYDVNDAYISPCILPFHVKLEKKDIVVFDKFLQNITKKTKRN